MGVATPRGTVEVDIWFADPERVANPTSSRVARERSTTQLLARFALARRFGDRLSDVRLDHDRDGRPTLVSPARTDVSFSLSHTRDLVVCGVADAAAGIGVDVEQRRPRANADVIARRFFCAEEMRGLARVPAARRSDRFWALWTLKESLVKAAGLDLFDGLSACAFRVRGRGRVSHAFPSSRRVPRGPWRFALLAPRRTHFIALAVRAGRGRPLRVHMHDVTDRLAALARSASVRLPVRQTLVTLGRDGKGGP